MFRRGVVTTALPVLMTVTLSLAVPVSTGPTRRPLSFAGQLAATSVPTVPVNRTRGGTTVGARLFGMHILHSATAWPKTTGGATLPVGFERVWDDHTTWRDIEPTAPLTGENPQTAWNWTRLDQQVATANAHHAFAEVTLGQTPQWASSRPTEDGWYGSGAAAPPTTDATGSLTTWKTYVGAVAQRYAGKVGAYEIWNEPDWAKSYSGSIAQLVRLTKDARAAIKAADPKALVASPSFVLSAPDDLTKLKAFLNAGGAAFVDVMAVHAYVNAKATPEAVGAYMSKVRALLAQFGVHKPIWNTEYTVGRASVLRYSAAAGGGMLARSYLLSTWLRLARLAWYAWDDHKFGGVWLTSSTGHPTTVTNDYKRVAGWIVGKRERSCAHSGVIWACTFRSGTSLFASAWARKGTAAAIVPKGFHHMTTLSGQRSRVSPGHAIKLGSRPVWLSA